MTRDIAVAVAGEGSCRVAVTIKDVAREAGVAVSTASRALSGRRRVSPEIVAAVRGAARRLDYRVDSVARSLRMGSTGTVGMVVPAISNPYFPLLVQAIERRLGDDRQIVLCDSQGKADVEAKRVHALLSRRVDGLFFVAADGEQSEPALREAAAAVSVIQLDRAITGASVDYIGLENDVAIRTVLDHLVARGCRTFAYVTSAPKTSATRERLDAFIAAAGAVDAESTDRVLVGDYSLEWGRDASSKLRASGQLPDAIICAADIIALGVLADLSEAGVRIPDDVAVTGVDDIGFARVARPSLTTLRQPVELIAEAAVRLLSERLAGDDGPPRTLVFPPELVVRDSTP